MTARLRVVASNLHQGGAVQVASSLVEEIARLASGSLDLQFELSPEVAGNLDLGLLVPAEVVVVNRRPWSLRLWARDLRSSSDATFVIFGPAWFPVRGAVRAVGYADVTSIYRELHAPTSKSYFKRLRRSVRSLASRKRLASFDLVIVESPAFAQDVARAVPDIARRIRVVPNCVSAQAIRGTASVDLPPKTPGVKYFLYTTAAYPHKNIAFLAPLGEQLKRNGVDAIFILTIEEVDWLRLPADFRRRSLNVGPVRLEQIAALHRYADAVIFPSLLEAFSATPLEALAFGSPLFASDRAFVRTVCHDAATYIDPLDAGAAARSISEALSKPAEIDYKVSLGRKLSQDMPGPRERAALTLEALGLLPERPNE